MAVVAASFCVAYAHADSGQYASPAIGEQTPAGQLVQLDDELWQAIKDCDEFRVFEEYIRQYPKGRYVALAKERLAGFRKTDKPSANRGVGAATWPVTSDDSETALWKVVFQADTSGGYKVFLKYYPKGKYASVATGRLKYAIEDDKWKQDATEQSAWQAAESSRTLEGYAAYLATYPYGRYVASAQAQSDKLKTDAAAAEEDWIWKAVEKGGISKIDSYLERYPNGRFASIAKSRRAQLKKEEAEMKPGTTVKDCPNCPEMIVIAAGSFRMGGDDQEPDHAVTIARPFAMARTEVTQSQWRAVMGTDPSKLARCDDCPVEGISWNDAQKYVEKLSHMTGKIYRLPSEAEWEYACRAGERHEYCGSDDIDSVAWHGALLGSGNSGNSSHPVGQKRPNAFGLYDMSGNVSEWVEDCFHAHYNGGPTDGSAWTVGDEGSDGIQGQDSSRSKDKNRSAKINNKDGDAKMTGETDSAKTTLCSNRVVRGGSWLSWPQHTRSAHRQSLPPDGTSSSYGFRPVWSLH